MFTRHFFCIFIALTAANCALAWTTPVPVSELNTSYIETSPFLSHDGLSLYFSRNTDGPVSLYQATRSQPTGTFTQTTQLSALNSGDIVGAPWVSSDNLRLYYCIMGSSWTTKVSQRTSASDPWPAGNTISGLTGFNVASPSLSADELSIVFVSNKSGGVGGNDIYTASRLDRSSPFGNITNLTTVNTINDDIDPFLSEDGLSLFFTSGPPNIVETVRLYKATRASTQDLFGNVQQISFSDTLSGGIRQPSLSADGSTLYFERQYISNGNLNADLYVSYVTEPADVAAGLVSHWEFSGNANDSMGLNNGILMNGASIGTDPVHGQVLSLDGANDYVDCGNNSSLDVGSGSFTVAAWVKRPSTGGVYDIIAKRDPTAPYTGWSFEMMTWNDGQGWRIKLWTPQEHGTAALFSFAVDTWYHVAAVRDAVNSQISYYVNGQSIGTLAFSNADLSNNATLTIGQLSEEYIQNFNGPIDDVRIYNTALTADEVLQLYASHANTGPTAKAGNYQQTYAGLDGIAVATLDGSDSNDPDGDAISYQWTWMIDGQINEANGVSPTIKLPVGTHTIQLIVNDGQADSAPDDVNITVIAAIEGGLKITPQAINRRGNQANIQALITLPSAIDKDDVDSDEPLVLYPGGIEAASQEILLAGKGRLSGIAASFDKAALIDVTPASGDTELAVAGKLKSGQCFYGKATVKIIH